MTIKTIKTVLQILSVENKDREPVKDVVDFLFKVVGEANLFSHITAPTEEELRSIKIASFISGYGNKENEIEATDGIGESAVETLKERLLDENGLMPCGCGGKAEIVRAIEYWDWIAQNKVEVKKVQCDKCYVSTPGSVTNEYAVQKWNTAMSGGACSHET